MQKEIEKKYKCIRQYPTAQYEDDYLDTFIEVGEEIDEDDYNEYAQKIYWINGGDMVYDGGITHYFQEVSMAEEILNGFLERGTYGIREYDYFDEEGNRRIDYDVIHEDDDFSQDIPKEHYKFLEEQGWKEK